jgi:large subunit ribosomal protein L24
MKYKTGDKVITITGKDKGKTGLISKVIKKENKVIVEGVNMVKKHVKPNANNQNGGIISVEAPINASNVMFVNEKTNKRSRNRVVTETKAEGTKATAKKEVKAETKEVKKAAPKKAKAKKD